MIYSASIIIPVYNSETTLQKCAESILFGSVPNVRIILVDDCSTDGSWDLCRKLSEENENVCAVRNEVNSGVSFTRNHGLSLAEGKYVLFVDSDDWVSGRYAGKLIGAAERYPDSLPVCGFRFLDYLHGQKQDYVWNRNGENEYELTEKQLFALLDRVHLQQIWNKAFRREIIEKNHLRFDETQSMGEDFQFVLDYLECSGIRDLRVLNEPLYFYTRSKATSLMSGFGKQDEELEYKRFRKVLALAGEDDPDCVRQYKTAIAKTKKNNVYRTVLDKSRNKKEKLALIEKIMGDGRAEEHYRREAAVLHKGRAKDVAKAVRQVFSWIQGRIGQLRLRRTVASVKKQLQGGTYSILSQNCIGGVVYHDLGQQFLSPTINLYFRSPDFVRFVLNLDHYLKADLRMTWGEEYPVGYLDDIPVFFQHYDLCSEAKEKWEERKQRLDPDKIAVFCTDRDGFTEETYTQWLRIPYPKLLFSATFRKDPNVLFFPEYTHDGMVGDLIPKREFYAEGRLTGVLKRVR
ncbi:MAG: DUF1919 domain-containing protein [Lachnospiraceae bacterium]|nr:DUF1919 domain-containing protein [Lachnospiraceae bacterium]